MRAIPALPPGLAAVEIVCSCYWTPGWRRGCGSCPPPGQPREACEQCRPATRRSPAKRASSHQTIAFLSSVRPLRRLGCRRGLHHYSQNTSPNSKPGRISSLQHLPGTSSFLVNPLSSSCTGPSRYAHNMVRFTVLASGSKGNCTVVTGGNTRILVDAGLSCRELFRRMRLAGEDPATLDAIIITHEHQDHVTGLAVTARKLGIPVYFTDGTHRAWVRWLSPRRQMTYTQWLEQCRKQAAARMAEADAANDGRMRSRRSRSQPPNQPPLKKLSRLPPKAASRKGSHLAALGPVLPGWQASSDRRHLRQPLHYSPRRGGSGWIRLPG